MISSQTSFLALIGNPIGHSLSPIMHNAALEYLGIDYVYLAIPCINKDFNEVINALKKTNCKGLNITIPYKEKVFNLCDEISPIAKKVKAINTLKLNEKGGWIGTNTDVEGFTYPLKDLDLTKKRSVILGSGGAARSSVQGLLNLKLSEINIISRNKVSLNNILKDFKFSKQLKGFLSDDNRIKDLINNSEIIINSTPVGMKHINNGINNLPFGEDFWQSLNPKTIVYDLIYNPNPTPLLKHCAKKGCRTIDGVEMLVAQGAKSLSFWTENVNIPIEVMRNSLKKYL